MKKWIIFFLISNIGCILAQTPVTEFILVSVNTYGQDTYIGKIIGTIPPVLIIDPDFPPLPCVIVGFETVSCEYVLSLDSHWICGTNVIVDGIVYSENDEVEITGTVSVGTDWYSEEYFVLEIETIKKLSSSINSSLLNKNKVHYNNASQIIVIDEDLQNQSIVFELIDMQGKVILQKTGVNNSISIENLPNGVYVYRLLENNQIICWGKIIK